jgi:hypothetical protein
MATGAAHERGGRPTFFTRVVRGPGEHGGKFLRRCGGDKECRGSCRPAEQLHRLCCQVNARRFLRQLKVSLIAKTAFIDTKRLKRGRNGFKFGRREHFEQHDVPQSEYRKRVKRHNKYQKRPIPTAPPRRHNSDDSAHRETQPEITTPPYRPDVLTTMGTVERSGTFCFERQNPLALWTCAKAA